MSAGAGKGAGDVREPTALIQVVSKAPADQAARNRLQDCLAPALGLLRSSTGRRLAWIERRCRDEPLKFFGDRERALHTTAVRKLYRRHRRPSEAEREKTQGMGATEQLDVPVREALALEHSMHAEDGVG